MLRIVWKRFSDECPPLFGHGIVFRLGTKWESREVVAFIDFPREYATIRRAIENVATSRELVEGQLSGNVFALIHG